MGGQPSLAFGRQNLISGSRSVCVCPQYVGAVLRDAPCPSMGVCRQGGGCGFGMRDGEMRDGAGAQGLSKDVLTASSNPGFCGWRSQHRGAAQNVPALRHRDAAPIRPTMSSSKRETFKQ